ncbi:ATP-binding protein [Streptomyces sp. NBC_01500]|uniref:ATP-binding protein n=1 Tax=Streptomyces sp. NBC_01500 TaxID=2903886 RepID=UPI00224D7C6D|nr:ATP-binding protein [Streptomyces sp. NBC_01500]MCX4554175.1 ATP-binding protein [Streptomyces sp. NBC_01500]MCX4554515.1 ATP-binding protein [Streptomyces sp. NBC_01500]
MTETQMRPRALIEGPVKSHRFGSVGFRLADPLAPSGCREAAGRLLKTFELEWVPDLVDDVKTIVTELVTNACKHAGQDSAYPAGSVTIYHPNKWLIIAVHDKSPYVPYRETFRGVPNPGDMAWDVAEVDPDADTFEAMAINGRGLQMVRMLAMGHCGTLQWSRDQDPVTPGKVAQVRMLLPDVQWRHTFTDPWTNRVVVGRA